MSLCMIFFALILAASSTPTCLSCGADGADCVEYYGPLCTGNIRPEQCIQIINHNPGFDTNDSGIARTSIDLARGKAVQILDQLNHIYDATNDYELLGKYKICIGDYNYAIRDIDQAKSYLDSGNPVDIRHISTRLHLALNDLEQCKHSFNATSLDPAHIMDQNIEFFIYGQLAIAAGKILESLTH